MAAAALLVIVTQPSPASGQSRSANYNFLVASGLVCDSNDSTTCPAVARAANGDTIEMSGAGTFSQAEKSVIASGAYTQKSSTGEIVTSEVWTATELLSFKPFGLAPGTLMRQSQKFKASRLFPLGLEFWLAPCPQEDWL